MNQKNYYINNDLFNQCHLICLLNFVFNVYYYPFYVYYYSKIKYVKYVDYNIVLIII